MYPMESLSPRAVALAELVARAAAALARGAARRWQGHQDLRRLQDMDDRLLEDLGVERYEIARAVGKAPWLDHRVR